MRIRYDPDPDWIQWALMVFLWVGAIGSVSVIGAIVFAMVYLSR